jgi:hypothetical protein
MHSQLSYTAAKFEIAERHRRTDRKVASGQLATLPRRRPRNPFARLGAVRRPAPVAVELASRSGDAI